MGYGFHRPSRDLNHKAIVDALKTAGVFVIDLSSVGGGVPDLLCAYKGHLTLIEVKNVESKYRRALRYEELTDPEIAFLAKYGTSGPPIHVVHDETEAFNVLGVPTENVT